MKISEDRLRQTLESVKSVLVVGHVKPDGDCLGSVLAITEALRARGVEADMLVDDTIAEKYLFLPLAKEIHRELPDKKYDHILFMDLSTPTRAGDYAWPENVPIVNIDHHTSNPDYADMLYLEDDAAATGEILTRLFMQWGWDITPSMANALYTAIATDCGFFRYGNTTAQTLAMAAELVDRGARPDRISQAMDSLPKEALTILGPIMSTLQFAADHRLSYIVMDQAAIESGRHYVDTYLDLARNIEGVELTLQFKYDKPQKTYVSFRSKNSVDVSVLAAQFGGGGHVRAAGCTMYTDLATAIAEVLPKAEAALTHAGNH
ncbi:MAG: bifunctional oligoribonuclease/PAP phosphatase NrnA [Negativicoccus succinicivorans]|nr:bifunctional oligoribonuclease/PAP phosphatase NrnA [Negativicoccus succinicivorans]